MSPPPPDQQQQQQPKQPKQPPSRGAGLKEARPDPPTESPALASPSASTYTTAPADSLLSTFPKSPSEFDQDYRVSYSKLDGKWILEAGDGSEYVWDEALRRWSLYIDEELLEQQRQAYRVEGVDENADVVESIKQQKRKRKQGDGTEATKGGKGKKKQRVNTAVYISNLPPDATFEELESMFSKCGVIAEGIDQNAGTPRIKMYEDDMGQFKGDALVIYFRPESVELAVQMLDDTEFRFGDEKKGLGRMKVQPADLSYKVQKDDGDDDGNKQKQGGGDKGKGKDDWNKRKIQRKTQLMRNKLADWDDDDPQTIQTKPQSSRWNKVVILKYMFTLEEIEEDPGAILDIKEDIRDECNKIGNVTNVVLYDKEKDGVVMVRFSTPEAARMCVSAMNGRYFGGTRVEAYIPEGEVKFKKSGKKQVDVDDLGEGWEVGNEDDDEEERLEKFSSWLERDKEA